MTGPVKYRVTGGRPVVGEIRCLGAKNFATKAIVAALLGSTPTTLRNVPPIGDVDITVEMLQSIGIEIERDGCEMVIQPAESHIEELRIPTPHSGSNRIPVLLLGALLHRCTTVHVPVLGGCQLGARRVDFHLTALEAFGAEVRETESGFQASALGPLRGCTIDLPYPSVGATETCLFAGVLAEGPTRILNAAIEPEICELIAMLRGMGAIIFTTTGREIRIEGVPELSGTVMEILGDRIEAASWASLACASEGDILVRGIRPDTLGNFLPYFLQVGGGVSFEDHESIRFYRKAPLSVAAIETDVWPGFSTDWQQPFAIVLCRANGPSVIHETVYENRFGYLHALGKLGANFQLTTHCLGASPCRYRHSSYKHSAIISGPSRLTAVGELTIPDLRAGLAYVIAAAIAEGTTTIAGAEYLERGYGNIVPRLQQMNVQIERIPPSPDDL